MLRGGSPNRSQMLMRWRVVLQLAAVVVIMFTIWAMAGEGAAMVTLNRIYTRTGDDGSTALEAANDGRNTICAWPPTAPLMK